MKHPAPRARARTITTLLFILASLALIPSVASATPPPKAQRVEPRAALPEVSGEMTIRRALRVDREEALLRGVAPDVSPAGVSLERALDGRVTFMTPTFDASDEARRAAASADLEALVGSIAGALPKDVQVAVELFHDGRTARWRARLVESAVILDRSMVAEASLAMDPNQNLPYVAVTLDEVGRERLREATALNAERMQHGVDALAIMVGDHLVSCPVVRDEIPGGAVAINVGELPERDGYLDASTILEAIQPTR